MLSIGFLVSALTKRAGVAVGIGLFLWLTFVFLGDLGLMGTAITMHTPIEVLFWVVAGQSIASLQAGAILDINATLDILGPAGIYAMQEYGSSLRWILLAILGVWIAVPALVAYVAFLRKSDL